MHEHPTQGLLDLFTVRQIKGRIEGLRVAIIGDVLHSRVARSAAWGFTTLGASVILAGPPTLLPSAPPVPGIEIMHALDQAVRGADVIMALRLQLERRAGGFVPTLAEYTRVFGITEAVLARARPGAILMHPGPANLGIEVSLAAACGPRSVITRQVENGVFVRMAVLEWVLGMPEAVQRPVVDRPAAQGALIRAAG
jgi:aspartate carbamoyltransferase catalytic subunit